MPVSVGGTISATDYNSIRSTLLPVYTTTYGQIMRSSAVVASSNKVTSQQMLDLFLDSQSCIVHQQGVVTSLISVPPTGQTIGANTSQTYNQSTGAKTTPVEGTEQGVNDYEQVVIDISNFDGSVSGWPDTSFSVGTPITSARSTAWGGNAEIQNIYHVVTFTFSSLTARSNFFNAGAELRFAASLASGAGSKDTDWANMLAAIGTVKFDKYGLTADSGTSAGLGHDDLTASYQQLYNKIGSGVYVDNDYTIEGRVVSDTVLRFRITFNDGNVGTVDESVGGTTTSTINTFRPDSSFVYNTVTYTAVDVAAPTITTEVALTTNNVSPPA